MTPLTHPAKKIDQMDSEIKDMGQSYMFKKKFISTKVLIVKVAQIGPLNSSSPKKFTGWTARSRTWGSPTCSRRSLSIIPNFQKERSQVPRMIPFTHPAQKIDQVDSENKDMGQSYMIQEKVIKNLLLLGVGVAKQFSVSMRCPKSRFPIWIIVFDELEIIIFVNQGLTLSTASLVLSFSLRSL